MISDMIQLKGIIWEDMVNYKKISTTLMFPICRDFKCDKENGIELCQNRGLAATPSEYVNVNDLLKRYKENNISEAIVFQGLEPLDSLFDVYTVSARFKEFEIYDDIVIYTGYYKDEIAAVTLETLCKYVPGHLIIKWGRYIPNQKPHFDPVLGVNLASDNQYGELIK